MRAVNSSSYPTTLVQIMWERKLFAEVGARWGNLQCCGLDSSKQCHSRTIALLFDFRWHVKLTIYPVGVNDGDGLFVFSNRQNCMIVCVTIGP